MVLGLFQKLAPWRGTATEAPPGAVDVARQAPANPAGAISIAVLPFANLPGDARQEFFVGRMTEEITSALAKVPDLRGVARTSAFEFKGKTVHIQTLGDQLGASHLIEGSVRKAGNRLSITAQLIKADDGTQIWAQDDDRELTDVFAIQEDIARAIEPVSHGKFLRGKALIGARGGAQAYAQAEWLLSPALAKSPDDPPAWAWLGAADFDGHHPCRRVA
jgi:adenylate cyclase